MTTATKANPLAQLVYDERQRLGMTQHAFADHIGATRNEIANLETRSVARCYPALIAKLERLGIDRDTIYAVANQIPPDIAERLTGNIVAIKVARLALDL